MDDTTAEASPMLQQLLDDHEDAFARLVILGFHQHFVFSLDQAARLGVPAKDVQRRQREGGLERFRPSVYGFPGLPMSYDKRVQIALLDAGPVGVGSRLTAGRILQLDGLPPAPIEVLMGRRGHKRVNGVKHRWTTLLEPCDIWAVGMMAVTSPARTIADLGSCCDAKTVERAFESAQRRYGTTAEEVDEMVERLHAPGRKGLDTVRLAMARVPRDGKVSGSDLEVRFFQLLRDAGLPLPVRQHHQLRDDDRNAYIDFAYLEQLIFIEVEGYDAHASRKSHTSDLERFNALTAPGRQILKFTWSHVMFEPAYVVSQVRKALLAAGYPLEG